MKNQIFTYSFNNPKYLEFQIRALNKFAQEPFDFTCIDNSIDQNIREQLRQVCIQYGIRHEPNQQPDHSLPGTSHYSALQWSYNTFMVPNDGFALMLDHDTFPIANFSLSSILGDSAMAGLLQGREHIRYLHPSCILLNLGDLPNKEAMNFNGQKVDDITVDIGGQLAVYFRNNPDVKVKYLKHTMVTKDNGVILSNLISQYTYPTHPFELIEDTFLHTRLGSNWSYIEQAEFNRRNNLVYSILNSYLA